MADHFSGPRALADPASDITDVFTFPSPEQPGHLVLVMDVFPSSTATALFSDALTYRFRLRPLTATTAGGRPAFAAGAEEYAFDVRFAVPSSADGPDGMAQAGTCTVPGGAEIPFRVGVEKPAEDQGMRVFAGPRLDPFFLDLAAEQATHALERLAFRPEGVNSVQGANVLSIVLELDTATVLGPDTGPLLGVVGETVISGAPGPAGAHGPPGDQELHPAGQEVRLRQPRPRDPRPLQRRGRLRPGSDLPRRLPRPAQREPALLRPARRQDRLAAGRPGRPPADRAAAGGLPRRRHLEAVLRRRLPGDRARRTRRPPAHHLRRPITRRRHRGCSLHAAGRRRGRTADQRRRRPADPAGKSQLPLPESPQPRPAGPEGLLSAVAAPAEEAPSSPA